MFPCMNQLYIGMRSIVFQKYPMTTVRIELVQVLFESIVGSFTQFYVIIYARFQPRGLVVFFILDPEGLVQSQDNIGNHIPSLG